MNFTIHAFTSAGGFYDLHDQRLDGLLDNPTSASQAVLAMNQTIAAHHWLKFEQAIPAARWFCDNQVGGADDLEALRFYLDGKTDRETITLSRDVGRLHLLFSEIRRRRPRRKAAAEITSLFPQPTVNGVNFGDFEGECFATIVVDGTAVDFYFHKFPYRKYDCCAVPRLTPRQPQLLTEQLTHLMWELYGALAAIFPNVAVTFNSNGGRMSICDMHFQVFLDVSDPHLPASSPALTLKKATEVCTTAADSWEYLDWVHELDIAAINVIIWGNQMQIVSRSFQNTRPEPDWTSGVASAELLGIVPLMDRSKLPVLPTAEVYNLFDWLAEPLCNLYRPSASLKGE